MEKFIQQNVIKMLKSISNIDVVVKDIFVFIKDGLQCHVFYYDNFDFIETYMIKSNKDFHNFIKEYTENK